MTVDKGGLQYPIETSAKLGPLEAFRENLRLAREEMRALREEAGRFAKDSGAARQGMRDTAAAAKTAASTARESAKATAASASAERRRNQEVKAATREMGIREIAEKRYARAVKEAAIQREFANVSEQRGFRLQAKAITQQQAQAAAAKKLAQVLSQRSVVEATLNRIKEKGLQLTDQELSKLGVLTAAQRRLAQAKERLARTTDLANNAQLRGLRIQEQVLARKTAAADNAEVARQLFLQGLDSRGRPLAPTQLTVGGRRPGTPAPAAAAAPATPVRPPTNTFQTLLAQAVGIQTATNSAVANGNRLVFTFRRLVGIFAVFALLRRGVQAFSDLITGAVRFNTEIESAELGIAGILVAVGRVRDAQGQAVDNAQAFVLAQKESKRQVALLRQDVLKTTSSLEQLVETFQVGLAPGLQAGLNIDQIRQFAVAISQAATAIGLNQRQLAEEIRSILGGTINVRNTRIAAALGITNSDIRRAKELGNLAQFLTDKFRAFTQVGEALANTFEGSLNRARTAFQLVLQGASLGFFNELKALLQQVFTLIVRTNEQTQQLEPRPEVLDGFKAIFEGLRQVVALVREGLSSFDATQFRAITSTIGQIAQVIGSAIVGAVKGIAASLKVITAALNAIRNTVKAISGIDIFDPATIALVVELVTRTLIVFGALRFTLVSVLGVWKALTVAIQVGRIVLTAFNGVLLGTRTLMAATIITAKTLRAVIASTGIGLLIVGLGVLVSFLLEKFGVFDKLLGTVETKADNLGDAVQRAFTDLPAQIATAAEALKNFDQVLESSFDAAERLRRERTSLFATPQGQFSFNPVGLDGDIGEQVRVALTTAVDLGEKLKQITKERTAEESKIKGLQFQQQQTELGILRILDNDVSKLEAVAEAKETLIALAREEQNITEGLAKNRQLAIADPSQQQKVNAVLAVYEARLRDIAEHRKEIFQSLAEEEDDQLKLVELMGRQVILEGQALIAQETVNELKSGQTELERAVNRELNERLVLLARESTFQATIANTIQRAENQALRLRNAAARQPVAQQEVAEATGVLGVLRAQLDVEQQKFSIQQRELALLIATRESELAVLQATLSGLQASDISIEQQRQLEAAEQALTALKERQVALREQEVLAVEELNLRIADQLRLQREAQIRASEGPSAVFDQIRLSLETLNRELPSQFEIIFDTLRSGIQGFSEFISSSLVDAFDPTKKVDLKARFGEFLRGLAAQIISTLIQIAVTRALLGLTGFFPIGFARGGQVQGFVHGGRVRRPRQHRHMRGFAEGGQIFGPTAPPVPGLDSRDTVPARVRPGEWLFPPDSPYRDAFPAMLRGLIDPLALKALAGINGHTFGGAARLNRTPQGFAEGGQAGRGSAAASVASAPSASPAGPSPAYIVANERQAERLLAGGRAAFVRFLDEEGYQRR